MKVFILPNTEIAEYTQIQHILRKLEKVKDEQF